MTYKDNFIVEVKCNGKILRIKNGCINLPFGSEYTLLLKNLNSRKASVKIHIDGQDVLDNSSLILEPNSTSELEGFLNGTVAKNHFKFIQKTKQIQEYRGDRIDDGLIRVEFAFEKEKSDLKILHEHYYTYRGGPFDWNYGGWYTGKSDDKHVVSNEIYGTSDGMDQQIRCCSNFVQTDSLGIQSLGEPLNDEGITVKGSQCHQDFRYGIIGELEKSEVITIILKGITQSGNTVTQPVTVKTKLQCPSCGAKCKSSFSFCPSCGTFLE